MKNSDENLQIPDAAVTAALDERLKAAGMYTIEEIMAGTPVDKWRVHLGMNNLQFFGEWLERKAREYKVMAAGYDLGDKDKSDELYEWVLAHSGAFHDVLVNFRAATLTSKGTKHVDSSMTQEEHRLENLKQMAMYAGPIVSFEVNDPFYLASCDHCGWVGSTEHCGKDSYGDDSDVYCPRCHASGADCGKVADRIAAKPVDVATALEAIRSVNMHDEANIYEWRGEGGDYTPKPHEKAMLEDFGHGLINQIEDAVRALSAEPAQGEQWQPIDTAPKDGTVIDLWANPSHVGACRYAGFLWDDGRWCQDGLELYTIDNLDVTHWMPLPAAPTPEAGA